MCFKIQFKLHKSNQTKPNKKIKKPKQNWNKKEDNKVNRKKKNHNNEFKTQLHN